MMGALLPIWIICAPAAYLVIDWMTAPKTSYYGTTQTRGADHGRSIPPHPTDRDRVPGLPA